jgi:2,3,4,5-tetrahydropyridine-2-carboxylate N-succinyltransferase
MEDAKMAFARTVRALESGEIRVARKVNGTWVVDTAVKEAILAGFKAGQLTDQSLGAFSFIEKDTLPLHAFAPGDRVRIVPGGSSVRCGAYLAPSVIMMPPSYVNIGAYVDEGTMLDSHSLVGSCAQVGKHVHLSAASQLGGVLEPAGALPVIIEDGVFIGGNCGIYEGTLVGERAVIGSGVVLTKGTALFDATSGVFVPKSPQGQTVVPAGAVVVAGSRPISSGPAREAGIHLYTPVIVKYRDGRTEASVELEKLLR